MNQETTTRFYKPGEDIFSLLKPIHLTIQKTTLQEEDSFIELSRPHPHALELKNRIGGILTSTFSSPKIHIETSASHCHILHVEIGGECLTTHNAGGFGLSERLEKIKQTSLDIGSISHLIIAGLSTVRDPLKTINLVQSIFEKTPIHYKKNTAGLIAIPKELSRSGKKIVLLIKNKDRDISLSEILYG